jgi:release factor glutamine methyltransferase
MHIEPSQIVIANLPYIPRERIRNLAPEVKSFEPILALDGGPDGLDLYRQLFIQLQDYDWQPTALFFEIDETHGDLITQLAAQYYPAATIMIQQDLAGMDRFISITQ